MMLRIFAAAILVVGTSSAAFAQFPTRPITLVVPQQAGGGSDAIARVLGEVAGGILGQPIIIENKPGAEGVLGMNDVKQAAPNGYRIALGGAGSLVALPALRTQPPYDPVADFTPIAGVSEFSYFFYVNASLPVKSMADYVSYAKAHPGKLSYASGNNLGVMSMAYFNRVSNIDAVAVPYKGEPAAVVDLLAGRVQAMFATSIAAPYVKKGDLRVLATSLSQRSSLFPEVPTLKEAGQQEVPFGGGWVAIFGPAGMPKDVVDRLSSAFLAAARHPSVQQKMDQLGLVPLTMTAAQLKAYVQAQASLYKATVRDAGIAQE